MSKIFIRKDSVVIAAALVSSKQEFVAKYSDTTASVATLEKAHDEINSNQTKSRIAVQSGDGKPDQPLTAIEQIPSPNYKLDKDGEIEVPVSLKLKLGKVLQATPNPEAAILTSEKPTKVAKPKATTSEKSTSPTTSIQGPSKRDMIRELIEGNATITNKEIKATLIEKGYKSCYDSEISAVRKK